MTNPDRIVRPLLPAEITTLIEWAGGEGWNPGLNDAIAFQVADPDGFLGAFVGGEMVAGISAVAYGGGYGFVGLYISRPDLRGVGHGKAVWDAGMARLAGRTVGLDGVDAQFDNYRSKGFAPAYRTIRLGGQFRPASMPPQVGRPIAMRDFPAIAAFDLSAFPAPREAFLARWLAPPHLALMVDAAGEVRGYGVMRRCRDGFKIGALVAADLATAKGLFATLAASIDENVYIDVPAPRTQFTEFLVASGLRSGFETTRMYLGEPKPLSPNLFGVTTLELG